MQVSGLNSRTVRWGRQRFECHSEERAKQWRWILLFSLSLLLFSTLWVALLGLDFSAPMFGVGDVLQTVWYHWFFHNNIQFHPLPSINFHTSELGFPFGMNAAFNAWTFESLLFNSALNSLVGEGPWLQMYGILSHVVTSVGLLLVLRASIGLKLASIFAIIVGFANHYINFKFPVHFNVANVHWAVIGIAFDFTLFQQVMTGKRVTLSQWLARTALLLASLGLDLGYIAGLSFTSFTLTFLSVIWQTIKASQAGCRKSLSTLLAETKILSRDFNRSRGKTVGIALICLGLAAAYLPLIYGLLREFVGIQFAMGSAYWANPARLLIPWFPGISPSNSLFSQLLGDAPEAIGATSPGWLFVLPATIGTGIALRTKNLAYLPTLVLLGLILVYHPSNFGVLKLFPWFAHMRVSGRATAAIPVLMGILSLPFLKRIVEQRQKGWILLLTVIGIIELGTSYSELSRTPKYRLSSEAQNYLHSISKIPGKAVLDWPLCVAGGNGAGSPELCPHFEKTSAMFALQTYHHKSTVSAYFGRLDQASLEPFLAQGWQYVLAQPKREFGEHLLRCPNRDELRFLGAVMSYYSFSGMNLAADRFAPNCLAVFEEAFGSPKLQSNIDGFGNLAFFVPPAASIRQMSVPRYHPQIDFSREKLDSNALPIGVALDGIRQADARPGMWVNNDRVSLSFESAQSLLARLRLDLENPLPDFSQTVDVQMNGTSIATLNLNEMASIGFEKQVNIVSGANTLSLLFASKSSTKQAWSLLKTRCDSVVGCMLNPVEIRKALRETRGFRGFINAIRLEKEN